LGAARLAWRRYQRPALTIECGDGFDFNKRVGNSDVAVAPAVEEHRALAAFATMIRIRETRGRSGAQNVVVRMKDVSPPAPHSTAFVELRWGDSREANDIRPHGHKHAFALLVIFYRTEEGVEGWRTTPTVLDHADGLEFTLEILVEGKPYSQTKFRMENTWSNARMKALPDNEWPPATIDFPKIGPA
jgi:hypothetical protein